jgi:hypothetical protein
VLKQLTKHGGSDNAKDNIMKSAPMKRYANFCQKYLQVLATQILFRHNADFLQYVTTSDAGIRVDPRERIIVIPRFKVGLFLLGELCTHPSNKRCHHCHETMDTICTVNKY